MFDENDLSTWTDEQLQDRVASRRLGERLAHAERSRRRAAAEPEAEPQPTNPDGSLIPAPSDDEVEPEVTAQPEAAD